MLPTRVLDVDNKSVNPRADSRLSCGAARQDGLRCLHRRDHVEPHASIDVRGDVVEWR